MRRILNILICGHDRLSRDKLIIATASACMISYLSFPAKQSQASKEGRLVALKKLTGTQVYMEDLCYSFAWQALFKAAAEAALQPELPGQSHPRNLGVGDVGGAAGGLSGEGLESPFHDEGQVGSHEESGDGGSGHGGVGDDDSAAIQDLALTLLEKLAAEVMGNSPSHAAFLLLALEKVTLCGSSNCVDLVNVCNSTILSPEPV